MVADFSRVLAGPYATMLLADLARVAGTSARSLQYAFREQYGTTPTRYLRQVRLDRARDDLAQAHGSVADIAAGRTPSAHR